MVLNCEILARIQIRLKEKKSFRPFHYKSGTESFVYFLVRVHSWFSSGVPERNAGSEEIFEQCWQRHSKPE